MKTAKLFSVAGISTMANGDRKVRFANDLYNRFSTLVRAGHTDIRLLSLGGEFTKAQAIAMIAAHPTFQGPADQAVIATWAAKYSVQGAGDAQVFVMSTPTPDMPAPVPEAEAEALAAESQESINDLEDSTSEYYETSSADVDMMDMYNIHVEDA